MAIGITAAHYSNPIYKGSFNVGKFIGEFSNDPVNATKNLKTQIIHPNLRPLIESIQSIQIYNELARGAR